MATFPQLCRNVLENRDWCPRPQSLYIRENSSCVKGEEHGFSLSEGVLFGEEKRVIEASIKTVFQLLPGVLHAAGQLQWPELDLMIITLGL